ncbi:MAG: CPBP family glutamic-type intramembrane protease, partial [Thermofilaceae archaeon]
VAVASLINAVTFRYLLLLLLQEVLGGRGQGVVATSAIYALAFAGASFHPPYTDVLAALALSLVFCLLYLWRGLFAAVAAEYTYNALAYALSISGLLPVDALLLAVTPLSAAPLASLLAELARRFAS